MISVSSDRLIKSIKLQKYISTSQLCTLIDSKARAQGIQVKACQEKVKLAGAVSTLENTAVIYNTQNSGYCKIVVYQTDSTINIYEAGESRNQKREVIHNALFEKNKRDAKEGGWGNIESMAFGAIGSAIVPKASKKAKLKEENYYRTIVDVVSTAVNELTIGTQPSYNTSATTSKVTYNNTTNVYTKQTNTTNYNTASTTRQSEVNYNIAKGEKTYINPSRASYSSTNNVKQTANNNNTTNNTTYAKPNTTNNNNVNNLQSNTSNSNESKENSSGCFSILFALIGWGVFGMIIVAIGNAIGIPPVAAAIIYIIGSIIYLNKDDKK